MIPCKQITMYKIKPRYGGFVLQQIDFDVFGSESGRHLHAEWWTTKQQAIDAKARLENP